MKAVFPLASQIYKAASVPRLRLTPARARIILRTTCTRTRTFHSTARTPLNMSDATISTPKIYETIIFTSAASVPDKLTTQLLKTPPRIPGLLQQSYLPIDPPILPPHAGHGPIAFPRILVWLIYENAAAKEQYAEFVARLETEGLIRVDAQRFVSSRPLEGGNGDGA